MSLLYALLIGSSAHFLSTSHHKEIRSLPFPAAGVSLQPHGHLPPYPGPGSAFCGSPKDALTSKLLVQWPWLCVAPDRQTFLHWGLPGQQRKYPSPVSHPLKLETLTSLVVSGPSCFSRRILCI